MHSSITRRTFVAQSTSSLAGLALLPQAFAADPKSPPPLPEPAPNRLPRWRGFNLLEKFTRRNEGNPPFRERDFEWIAKWGFNFARLPMSYLCWSDAAHWRSFREDELKHIDQAVEFGKQHGVHVNLNFHRAPGYCVNPPAEPKSLWTDDEALEVCALHWAAFAKRHRGIPNRELTFDLLNEPADVSDDIYFRVVKRLVEAIRAEDPSRLIIADGLRWGNKPVPKLIPLGVAQSTRGYQPMRVSHHKASWVNGQNWPEPSWPLTLKEGDVWDKERLRKEQVEPWLQLAKQGSGVHVGEWGPFNRTLQSVALPWMKDYLDLWKEAGWGWALWNLRGSFGIVDSGREGVAYDDMDGHKLDRTMLELLQAG